MASIGARLERLPVTSLHRKAIVALAFAYFFELGDISTFAFAAPSIVHEWGISVHVVAMATAAAFGGMFLGATVGGWFGDRIGRKRGLLWSVIVYTLFSLCNAFAWDVPSLVVFRFLTGIGLSSMTVITNTYISEVFPAAQRGRYLGTILTIGLIGIPATAWVARFVVPLAPWGWRLVFVWGALGVFALFFTLRIPESPRWYHLRGFDEDADRETTAFEQAALAEHGTLPPPDPAYADEAQERHTSYGELFARQQVGRTMLLIVMWVFQTIGAYGFTAWVPTLLVERGFSVVQSLTFTSIIAVCNPLGAYIAALLIERVDRKWFLTIITLVIGTAGLLYGLTMKPAFILIFGAIDVLAVQGFTAALYVYTPELFPTRMRASGHGIAYGLGRLANVVGPFIVAWLYSGFGYLSVFIYIAICWVITSASVGIFGPLTSKRNLETLNH